MKTGHEKNVTNFETVVIVLLGLGAVYDPGQALIILTALQHKLTEAKAAIEAVNAAQADKTLKVDELQNEFKGFDQYVINIKRTAEVELNDDALNHDLQNIANRMHAQSRKTGLVDDPLTPEDESRTAHSVSMRSYDNLIGHLTDIYSLLKLRTDYTPTDTEYDLEAIEAKIASLTAKNNAVKNAETVLGNAQDARDTVLYDPAAGVLKLVKLIKTQLAKKPGKTSAAYQQIIALEFRRY